MRVALYACVAASNPCRLAEQIESLRSWARSEGHRVAGEYADDGYPATTFERPGLQALREAAASGVFDAVAVR